ncbi:hypothetical protein Y032_0348g3182 [Ancylostoma ceylanicum]|uniref:RNA-directed DNA polymerase n=1 Tax=Ancylostoma ceylanicum TaxID=53326 RepID=A0A016RY34_9BILA|nr:hypothetical protein Y032_0348g3182 [Ancylostoma ceylanicum]
MAAAPPQNEAPEEPMEVGNTYNPWCQALQQVVRECDSALSAQIRHLSALKRQRILAAVQNAVNGVQKVFEDERRDDQEAREIVQALGTSAERLSEILPDLLNDAAQMRVLTEKLGCNANELERLIEEKEEENAVLKAKLENFQVERPAQQPQVQQQPERPPRPPSGPRVGKFDGQAWSQAREFIKFVDVTKSLQSCATAVSAKKTEWRRSNQTPTSDVSSPKSSLHSSHSQGKGRVSPSSYTSSCRPASAISQNEDLLRTLKEVLKSQSIAEVKKYDGKSSLTEFLRGLEVKYPRSVWSDTDRRDILLNHLDGSARTHANNLPAEILNGSFDGLVEELRKARRTPCERLRAQADWKNLRKLETESVFDFCCRLRSIAKRKSPDSECDFEMGSKLYECLSDWKDSYYMLAALDSPEGTVDTHEVRKVALRLERTQEPSTSTAVEPKTWKQRYGKGKVEQKQEQSTAVPPQSPPRKQKGDNPRQRAIPQQQRGPPRNPRNKDQPKSVEKAASKPKAIKEPSTQSKRTQNTFSTHLKSWCCKIKRIRSPKPDSAYGGPCLCNIEIFGMKAKALIDTGSVITIIPLGLLKKAMEQGADLDEMVTMMGSGSATQVYDASGNPMSFLMLIATTISVEGAGSARVQMHIQKSENDTILLGTNALESLGIRIQLGSSAKEDQQPKRDSSESLASAAHKVIIPPFSAAEVELTGPTDPTRQVFLSSDDRIASAVCQVSDGHATVSVVNRESKAWKIPKGQPLGTWTQDRWYDPKTADIPGDMLEMKRAALPSEEEKLNILMDILKQNRQSGDFPPELEVLLKKYCGTFAISDVELTQTHLLVHDIDVQGHPPIRQKTRPVPYALKLEVQEMLKDLKERQIIEESSSPWASPIVLVAKKDGGIRLCVDYREVNKVTKKDCYPLPSIDVALQNLQGKHYFTSLDLASGYWQVPLSDSAKEISAFTTTAGLYQFRVIPFGLTNAPAAFQRLMEKVLCIADVLIATDSVERHFEVFEQVLQAFQKANLAPAAFQRLMEKVLGHVLGPEVSVYIDDVLIATDSVERHFEVFEQVLQAFQKANLKIKPQKCRIFETRVAFLGHVVDDTGVKTDPDKINNIVEYPRPENLSELRTFLGMCGYYRKFVLRYAQTARPLYDLTSTKVKFEWKPEHEKAFLQLKVLLTSAPVLAQPDVEKARSGLRPFYIYTDASRVGVGAVLAQEQDDGFLHPIYFASKPLSKAERNYHVTDQEGLAVVYALKKFHYFIYGVHTIVRTDHATLTSLFKRKNVSTRVLRWALEIQRYDLTIEHVKGAANCVADALSRGVVPLSEEVPPTHSENEKIVCVVQGKWLDELREDKDFEPVIDAVENDRDVEVRLPRYERKLSSRDFRIDNGDLCLVQEDGSLVLVVPEDKRRPIFDEAHHGNLGGHFNADKMFLQLRKTVFWPGMKTDLKRWCGQCQKCFLTNPKAVNTPPLRPRSAVRPFQIIGVDVLEMGLTSRGNRYIVTVVDHFTKYLGAYPVPDKKADTIAEVIFSRWICEGGRWPECILSDRGGEFENAVIAALCEVLQIKQDFTKGYCPRENGLTERANGTIVRMLKKKTIVPTEWDRILPAAVYAYNASPHEATAESPHFLVYGHDPKYPSEVIPRTHLSPYHVDYDNYKAELLSGLKLARATIADQVEKYQRTMKEQYDRRHKTSASQTFRAGDRVYMLVPSEKGKSKHPKLVFDWRGPYRVLEASSNSALITLIGMNEEPVRVPFDHLIKVPSEIDDTPVIGKSTRGRRGRPRKKNMADAVSIVKTPKDLRAHCLLMSKSVALVTQSLSRICISRGLHSFNAPASSTLYIPTLRRERITPILDVPENPRVGGRNPTVSYELPSLENVRRVYTFPTLDKAPISAPAPFLQDIIEKMDPLPEKSRIEAPPTAPPLAIQLAPRLLTIRRKKMKKHKRRKRYDRDFFKYQKYHKEKKLRISSAANLASSRDLRI